MLTRPFSSLYDRYMRARSSAVASMALLLLLTVTGLTALAHGSPPDSSWIHGVYDAADFDDIIIVITSAMSGTVPEPAIHLRPIFVPATLSARRGEHVALAHSPSSRLPRAPPTV